MNGVVSLSPEGQKEFGYIFKGYVPVVSSTPIKVDLDGLGDQHSFLVDWKVLSEDQQSLILQYMGAKFGASQSEICGRIEADGHFPIRSEWVIESYSLRMFM